MRFAEEQLADSERQLQKANEERNAAQARMNSLGLGTGPYSIAQELFNRATASVRYYEALVKKHHAAVEQIRQDARRANVPPGWLRWR